MAFDTISTLQKNRVWAPIFTGLAILLAVIFVRPAFSAYSDADAAHLSAEKQLKKIQAELSSYEQQKSKIGTGTALSAQIAKINQPFSELGIMRAIFVNPHTKVNGISATTPVVVTSAQLDKGSKLPNGIFYGKANIQLQAKTANDVVDYLTYLTTSSPYAFTLNDINLPLDTLGENSENSNGISVPVSIGFYYFQDK